MRNTKETIMRQKLFSSVKILSLAAVLLSGCGTAQPAPQETPEAAENPAVQESNEPSDVIIPDADVSDDFTSSLVRFIEASGYENQNYIISPTSFRAALALAAAGADTDTKTELLSAMGFADMEELSEPPLPNAYALWKGLPKLLMKPQTFA